MRSIPERPRSKTGLVLLAAAFLSACVWAGCHQRTPSEPRLEASSPYIGSEACAECHADLFRRQSASPHALTFRPVPADWAAGHARPDLRLRDPETGLDYAVDRRGGKLVQIAYEGGREVGAAPLVYMLGSGHHGMSPLTFQDGQWRYLRLTHYSRFGWDLSPMHGRGSIPGDRNVHGWPLTTDSLTQCLHCHTTRLEMAGTQIDAGRSELGIRCESCHGPARAHVEAMRANSSDKAIENPSRWSPQTFMALCQQCHSGMSSVGGMERGSDLDPASPELVLNQAHGITASRCFKESKGRLLCTTCHDPHSQSTAPDSAYDQRCRSCHAGSVKTASTCPIQPQGSCVRCHMPRVQVAPHTTFADHWIRAKSPFVDSRGEPRAAAKQSP